MEMFCIIVPWMLHESDHIHAGLGNSRCELNPQGVYLSPRRYMSHFSILFSFTRISICKVSVLGRYLHRSSHNRLLKRDSFTRPATVMFSHLHSTMVPIERLADKLEAPALDDRTYRVIRLPNRLEALLVHDPDTDKASASVNVNVGSFSDADDMPGMAHAVEHLLFMGTEKVRG